MNCSNCNHEIDLHEHDAEQFPKAWHKGFEAAVEANEGNKKRLIAEVRKPLVDLLQEWTIKHGRNSPNWKDCELADRSLDALAKVKQ